MKKLLITASIFTTLLSSNALAKTAGDYIGLSLITTELEAEADLNGILEDKGKAMKMSGGISYKYALNFGGFFVAPEVFYDQNGTESKATFNDGSYVKDKIKYSYGVKVNAGYDITDNIAAYAIVGHSENKLTSSYVDNSGTSKDNHKQEALIYGVGAKLELPLNFSVNASYEMTQFGLSDDIFNDSDNINPDIRIIRVGIAYNF